MPAKLSRNHNSCRAPTFSPTNQMPISVVAIGERCVSVVAAANGTWCSNQKFCASAAAPAMPRKTSSPRRLPSGEMPARMIPNRHRVLEITARKKMISSTGRRPSNLTHTAMTAKNRLASNMYITPRVSRDIGHRPDHGAGLEIIGSGSTSGLGFAPCSRVIQQLLEFAGLEHLGHDVAATNQLTVYKQLREGRPVAHLGQVGADFRVAEDVDVGDFLAAGHQDLGGARRKAALRLVGVPFHVAQDRVVLDLFADGVFDTHGSSPGN